MHQLYVEAAGPVSQLKENVTEIIVPWPKIETLNRKKIHNFVLFLVLKHEFCSRKKHPFFLENV